MKHLYNRLLLCAALTFLPELILFERTTAPAHWTLSGKFAFYIGAYAVPFLLWLVLIEFIYWIVLIRRRKTENQPTAELPVPDTQPLERK